MQESAQAALSYIRSRASDFGVPSDWFETHEIHPARPCRGDPEGRAERRERRWPVPWRPLAASCRADVAMTGEVTLAGESWRSAGFERNCWRLRARG